VRAAGIDIGSRHIKLVLLGGRESIEFHKRETGHEPLSICNELIQCTQPDRLIATGYGRCLLELDGSAQTMTEIKAVAKAAREFFPSCRTIVDIGGQDTKAIRLNRDGGVVSFEMNDRCAAGTGKFLEIMAKALGYELDAMGSQCHENGEKLRINSMCTVFAESEVISLIAKGVRREAIAGALHQSIVNKVVSLILRVGLDKDLVFAGGCARNPCLKGMLEDRLQCPVLVNDQPDMLTAFGAALYALDV
jgi:(R)-2-hydroxyacyl-CoA dehydratese activating ATPase